MNRESMTHFSSVPYIEHPRSTFDEPQKHITTGSAGRIIPFYVSEVLPGDTHRITPRAVIRMLTPLYPTMDSSYADLNFFYVPNRLIWTHWERFNGDDQTTAWENPVEYNIPQIEAPSGGWAKGTIADYMGIPTGVSGLSVNALPFRAYCKVYNDWWRDENLLDPCMIHLDDTTRTGSNGTGQSDTYVTTAELGAKPLVASKLHDYFTSATPKLLKGEDVLIPSNPLPVYTTTPANLVPNTRSAYSEKAQEMLTITGGTNRTVYGKGTYAESQNWYTKYTDAIDVTGPLLIHSKTGIAQDASVGTENVGSNYPVPINLWADAGFGIGTISELRQAVAIQHVLERLAVTGTRYTEILRGLWGISAPDYRLQRSEYLGGMRVPLNIDQVLQTSETSTTPLGETGAFSNTLINGNNQQMVEFSSVEGGFIIGTCTIRIKHTYQQGLERMWTRKTKWDFYNPLLEGLSEQAVRLDEIYAQGTSDDETVFGYQERWSEYKYKPNRVSGAMRSNYATSLDAWHYADYYTDAPSLSGSWIQEGDSEIDRTLAVSGDIEDQFLMDFYTDAKITRMMRIFSTPGLERL